MEQHHELESMGILRQTKLPATLAWMDDGDKALLLQLHLAGPDGLSAAVIRKFAKKSPDAVLKLDVHSLAEWQSDKHGQPAFLVMTWKGEEIGKLLLQVARNESRGACRRADDEMPAESAPD